MPRNTRALAGLALRKARAEYKADNPEPRDEDTTLVLARLEKAKAEADAEEIAGKATEAVAAFAAIQRRYDPDEEAAFSNRSFAAISLLPKKLDGDTDDSPPVVVPDLTLIDVLARAVRFQRKAVVRETNELKAQRTIGRALLGLGHIGVFIEMLKQEAQAVDRYNWLDCDLDPDDLLDPRQELLLDQGIAIIAELIQMRSIIGDRRREALRLNANGPFATPTAARSNRSPK